MRIAIFCNDFWPSVGGVQTGVWGVGHALRRRNHAVVVVTRRPPGCAVAETVGGLDVRRYRWNVRPWSTFPLRASVVSVQLSGSLGAWRPDIILAHFVSVHAVFAWQCARRLRVPLILSFRGNDALHIVEENAINRFMYRFLSRQATVNLFCSRWLMDEVMRSPWFSGLPELTGVWADAVEVAHREPTNSLPSTFLLAAGRLVQKKGLDLLLRAWASLRGQISAALLIAGDGPEEDSLKSLAAELGVGGSVRFLGRLSHSRLLGLLERSALCIVPSREEPYGIIVVEAQALGIPVLACDVGNVPHLIDHGVTGYLCSPTVEGLAHGCMAAWRDPRRSEVGAAGKAASGALRTYEVMAVELEDWIQRAVLRLSL